MSSRGIGPVGTVARIAIGLGLVYLATLAWTVEWYDLGLGLVALPVVHLAGCLGAAAAFVIADRFLL